MPTSQGLSFCEEELKGEANSRRAGGSSHQIPLSRHKKDFKGKANSRQEGVRLLKRKYTLSVRSATHESGNERHIKMAGYELFVLLRGRAQENVLMQPAAS